MVFIATKAGENKQVGQNQSYFIKCPENKKYKVKRSGVVSLLLPVSTLNMTKYPDPFGLDKHRTDNHFRIQREALC